MSDKPIVRKLRFCQKFGDGCRIVGVSCDEDCTSRAVALWGDDENHGFAWCEKHRQAHSAPDPTPGIECADTKALISGWVMRSGVPVFIGKKNA